MSRIKLPADIKLKALLPAVKNLKAHTKLLIITICICVFSAVAVTVSAVLFLRSGSMASEAVVMDRMALEISTAAEALKAAEGSMQTASQLLSSHRVFDISEDSLVLYYDENFSPSSKNSSRYRAVISRGDHAGFYSYDINVFDDSSEEKEAVYTLSFNTLDTGGASDE